jgi:hypothetical protein
MFISLVPGFDGDVPIPAIPVLIYPPGDVVPRDSSVGASASVSRTQASKRKATGNPTHRRTPKSPRGNHQVE